MLTSALFSLAAAIAACGAVLPAGTELQVRLTSGVSSDRPAGQPVNAVVTTPVFADGEPLMAAGAILSGKTADAAPAKLADTNTQETPATLRLRFETIQNLAGRSQNIQCVVETVDNARETVDQTGLITGITASKTWEARIDQGIGKIAARNEQFAQLLSSVESAFVKKVDPSIDFKPGVELTVKLTRALTWTSTAPGPIVPAIPGGESLVRLVQSEPARTVAQNPPKPSDLTNLLFIGSLEQIEGAFHAAGWFSALADTRDVKMETARALIENRGYSEAPMSVLFLNGRPPDLTFQKSNDTFAMRHHIRIWLMPAPFGGKPVWVAAATHDIGITFSPVSHNFTHRIDQDIDKERAKVVNDLLFTGLVRGLALVERSGIPPDLSNATGDALQTDGRIAVVGF